ncbi:MAG: hypothetical protein ISS77_00465 [Phycisphaerae bacterium]|nr:hypothetical protein [Phycisphaerae bacterium]
MRRVQPSLSLLAEVAMPRYKRAFSLTEMILVVLFIGIFAAISIPRLNFAIISKSKVGYAAQKIVTDLRRTRMLAISEAATNTTGYELRMVSGTPYSSYQIKNRDGNTVVDTLTIDSAVSCSGDNKFRFGPLGNLVNGSGDELVISAEGKTITISLETATGMVKCVEN